MDVGLLASRNSAVASLRLGNFASRPSVSVRVAKYHFPGRGDRKMCLEHGIHTRQIDTATAEEEAAAVSWLAANGVSILITAET